MHIIILLVCIISIYVACRYRKSKNKVVVIIIVLVCFLFQSFLYEWSNFTIPEKYCEHSLKELYRIVYIDYGTYIHAFPDYDKNKLALFWDYSYTVNNIITSYINDTPYQLYKMALCAEQNPKLYYSSLDTCSYVSYWYFKYKCTNIDELLKLKEFLINEVYTNKSAQNLSSAYGLLELYNVPDTYDISVLPLIIEKPGPYLKHKQGVCFLDGHVERIGLNEKWPITSESISIMTEIELYAKDFFSKKINGENQ